MSATLTIGMMLIGAALGFGLAGFLVGARKLAPGKSLAVRVACVFAGAVLVHLAITPVVRDACATQRARAELLAVPVYQVIEKHEPAVFERLLAEYERVVLDRSRIDIYTHFANSEISTVATRHIAHASDPALLALMQDMLDKLQVLKARSPEDCYRYLFPKVAGPPDIARWFDHDSQTRTLGRMADVIRTSVEQPVPLPPQQRVEGLLGPLVNDMYAQYGESTRLLSRAEEPGVNRQTVCAIAVTLYEKVMRLPPADAAAVIRSMTQL